MNTISRLVKGNLLTSTTLQPAEPRTLIARSLALPLAIAFGSLLGTSANAQQTVALGDATISNCSFGQTSAPDKACYTEVRTFEIAPNDSAAISSLLAERGWRLATPEEVAAAWENLGLDTTSFYKMSDGRFAVPSQNGIGAVFQRGVNFRDPGVATFAKGIFYVDARAPSQPSVVTAEATITPDAPTAKLAAQTTTQQSNGCPAGQNVVEMNGQPVCSTPITLSGPANDSAPIAISQDGPIPQQFFTDQAADRCADPGNFMLDGWNSNARPVLEEAARSLFPRLGWADSSASMTRLISALQSDPEMRWEFAPHMINAAWAALTSKSPSVSQQAFKRKFEVWAGCDRNLMARRNINRWNQAMGRSIDASINGVSVEWIDPNPTYKPNTLAVLNDTGPSIGSTGYDVTNDGNPMYIGEIGREQIARLFKPAMLRTGDELDDLENLRLVQQAPFNFVYGGEIGFTGTLIAGLATSFGIDGALGGPASVIWRSTLNSARTAKLNSALKAKHLAEVAETAAKEAAEQGVQRAASSLADDVAEDAVKLTFRAAAKKAAQKLGGRISTFLGPKFLVSAAGPILSGVSFFASVFGEKLADVVKTNEYEEALIRDSRTYEPFDVDAMLGSNPGEAQKAPVISLLAKMVIAEPADRHGLTLEIPSIDCPMGFMNDGLVCAPKIGFYQRDNISLSEAKSIAQLNPWIVSNAFEIENAWIAETLDQYAFGLLDNGQFAVPVQRDYSNFKKGANIGASGGNQGFFYTLAFVDKSFATDGATVIQNGELLDKFLVFENTFQANASSSVAKNPFSSWVIERAGEYYRIKTLALGGEQYLGANSGDSMSVANLSAFSSPSSTLWSLDSAGGSFVRIQSVAFPHRYIAIASDGASRLSAIKSNDKGALWHVPFVAGREVVNPEVLVARMAPPVSGASLAANEFAPIPGFVRLQNQWYKNLYINNEGQQLSLGEIQPNWWSAMWRKIPTVAGFFLLQNRYRPTEYLHIQNGKLELGPIAEGEPWWSAQWREVPTGDGWVQIQNRWKTDHYLNNSSGPTGKLEAIPVQPNWASAKWKVE